MAFKLIPRTLHTMLIRIEFLRYEHDVSPFRDGPWYRVGITVNGEAHSCEVQLISPRGFSFPTRPDAFGALKYPVNILAGYVRRFAEGEAFKFPIDLGDIGKV